MIQRMYLKFFEKSHWTVEEVFVNYNTDGINHAIFKVQGEGVKNLKGEGGNHRFTRYSPFGRDKLHTSFVGISVDEIVTESPIIINEKDVKMTFFKGTGPGGQHKNKVETGVRLLHLPTKICVEVANERSQLHNKELAWERLRAKIYTLHVEAKNKAKKSNWENSAKIGFSEKRRSYLLNKNIIKDEISQNKYMDVGKILDGNIPWL